MQKAGDFDDQTFEPASSRHKQVRSGDKSVKSLSVKQPQADFFLSPCQIPVEKVYKVCYYVVADT